MINDIIVNRWMERNRGHTDIHSQCYY